MIHINGATKLVGILGWPLSHTLSPYMHNAAFQSLGLNWAYVPLPTAPEQIKDAIGSLQTFNFMGANVTVPHKQAIMRYLDEIDSVARNIGAVNTIAIRHGKTFGYNTDCYGFLESLIEANFDPKGARCLILGAGGAARATVFSLAQAGAAAVAVYNRTVERAAFLVDDLQSEFGSVEFSFGSLTSEDLRVADHHFDLIVNTTSVGMTPAVETNPWPKDIPLPNAVVCDLVYNPLETQFLQQAKAAGLKTIDGVGMLVHQGAKAFEIWTGQSPPTDVTRRVVLKQLQVREKQTNE